MKLNAEANIACEGNAVAFMTDKESVGEIHQEKIIFKLDSGACDHLVNEKK